jgi:tRNA threonylcarbamoyladenosine biosynthesis protein TsaB
MADRPLLLAIDTASDVAGAALMDGDSLLAETTWRAHQSHSVQLLPAVDWLLSHVRRTKDEIGAVAVCLGPGSYAGMRVGISTAKALAFGLDAKVAGVGRLAAEALPVAEASGARVVPVQAAGRAELAWAVYQQPVDDLLELAPPRLGSATELLAALRKGDVLTGDIDRLDSATLDAVTGLSCRLVPASPARVVAVARLGLRRLASGETEDAGTLVPLYLRAPAIGPQPPR